MHVSERGPKIAFLISYLRSVFSKWFICISIAFLTGTSQTISQDLQQWPQMTLILTSATSTVQPLRIGNGYVISSPTLLGMWLLIHAGIRVNPWWQNGCQMVFNIIWHETTVSYATLITSESGLPLLEQINGYYRIPQSANPFWSWEKSINSSDKPHSNVIPNSENRLQVRINCEQKHLHNFNGTQWTLTDYSIYESTGNCKVTTTKHIPWHTKCLPFVFYVLFM